MDTRTVIRIASDHMRQLEGHLFDVLEVKKPISPEAAANFAKIVSKLSPLVGNMIEFNAVEYLNDQEEFKGHGKWVRQDPGFPDMVFQGVTPTPGFEVKAWLPLATEITGRFKGSQNHFCHDQTYVAMLAWLPEFLLYGKPKIVGVCIMTGDSVARARDQHYHNPPDYLVIEPEDTTSRACNLRQTTTAGYKFQDSAKDLAVAEKIVDDWGEGGTNYKPTPDYQQRLKGLMGKFTYRNDTNFAKMDRIDHAGIEKFKQEIYATKFSGMTIGQWNKLLNGGTSDAIKAAAKEHLHIKEEDAEKLLA